MTKDNNTACTHAHSDWLVYSGDVGRPIPCVRVCWVLTKTGIFLLTKQPTPRVPTPAPLRSVTTEHRHSNKEPNCQSVSKAYMKESSSSSSMWMSWLQGTHRWLQNDRQIVIHVQFLCTYVASYPRSKPTCRGSKQFVLCATWSRDDNLVCTQAQGFNSLALLPPTLSLSSVLTLGRCFAKPNGKGVWDKQGKSTYLMSMNIGNYYCSDW